MGQYKELFKIASILVVIWVGIKVFHWYNSVSGVLFYVTVAVIALAFFNTQYQFIDFDSSPGKTNLLSKHPDIKRIFTNLDTMKMLSTVELDRASVAADEFLRLYTATFKGECKNGIVGDLKRHKGTIMHNIHGLKMVTRVQNEHLNGIIDKNAKTMELLLNNYIKNASVNCRIPVETGMNHTFLSSDVTSDYPRWV
jgi:hypothetical protein